MNLLFIYLLLLLLVLLKCKLRDEKIIKINVGKILDFIKILLIEIYCRELLLLLLLEILELLLLKLLNLKLLMKLLLSWC